MEFSGTLAAEGYQSSEGDGNSAEKAVKSYFSTRIQNLLPGYLVRSTQPPLWPACPPALHIADPRPANRNFQFFHPWEGEAGMAKR